MRWVAAAALIAASLACGPRGKLPEGARVTVDFGDLFTHTQMSRSLYPIRWQSDADELLGSILLSPNLVFESSRSSREEPTTAGPPGKKVGTPQLADALGAAVTVDLSAPLLQYLTDQDSLLITPAITTHWRCPRVEPCSQATWLERLLAEHARNQGLVSGPEQALDEVTSTAPLGDDHQPLFNLPTAALGVRDLGIEMVRVEAVVDGNMTDGFRVRPRKTRDESSICEAVFDVPVLRFSAEIVSAEDGRLLARIDEVRPMPVLVNLRRRLRASSYKRVGSGFDTKIQRRDILCRNIERTQKKLRRRLVQTPRTYVVEAFDKLFESSLAPMFAKEPADAPSPPAAAS